MASAAPVSSGKSLHLTVITPARAVLDAQAASVVAPAFDGEVGVLPGHAPMLALLGQGELRIHELDGRIRHLAVRGGFLQVNQNRVTVLTPESFTPAELKPEQLEKELQALTATEEKTHKLEERDALDAQRAWVKIKEKVSAAK